MSSITTLDDFRALDPFFRIIEQGLAGLADGDHFFDLLADDVVLEYASEGHAVQTGAAYGNRYISVLTITNRKVTGWRDYLDPIPVFDALGWPAPRGVS